MARVAVLVPGIMGSCLWHDDGTGGRVILWDEDFKTNYRNLISDPKLLAWTGKTAKSSLLRYAHGGWWSPKYKLWDATIGFLNKPGEFSQSGGQIHFSYDWRRSLIDTADDLAAALSQRAGEDVAHAPPAGNRTRFVLIAHSMGGVLARVALGLDKLHAGWLDRLFVIGSPLQGAPQALNSLYGDVSPLPLLVTFIKLTRYRNQQRFLEYFRECLQSCPSAYQLLPHVDWWYLYYGPSDRRNALQEPHIGQVYREYARDAHEAAKKGALALERANVRVYAIFTKIHFKKQTEMEYRVNPKSGGYTIDEVHARTDYGDGTVPTESARDTVHQAVKLDVESVTHATMCNDRKVVDRLRQHIN